MLLGTFFEGQRQDGVIFSENSPVFCVDIKIKCYRFDQKNNFAVPLLAFIEAELNNLWLLH